MTLQCTAPAAAAATLIDQGKYGPAMQRLDAQLAADGDVGSAAHMLMASLLRQIGRHDLAIGHDRVAWGRGADRALRIGVACGLSADHIGAGDAAGAARWLKVASETAADGGPDAAARGNGPWADIALADVTLEWVGCEYALLTADPASALAAAGRAVALAEPAVPGTTHSLDGQSRAAHALAKSLLFRGVCEQVLGRPRAAETLAQALVRAQSSGLEPLVWPAAAQLALLDPARADELTALSDRVRTRLMASVRSE